MAFDPWLAFGWSVFAGTVMSLGGGGGGIIAGIGHVSVLGIADANAIKVLNQVLEFASRCTSVPLYQRQKRLAWSLAAAFAIGAPLGSIAGSWVSKAWLSDLAAYRRVFGFVVVVVAVRTLYEAWSRAARRGESRRRAREATDRAQAGGAAVESPRTVAWSASRVEVQFAGERFAFNPWAAAGGGFAIAFAGALLGIAGGFLITPFLASVLAFPMYLAAGTSLLASMVPLVASVAAYHALEVSVDGRLLAVEVPGVLAGSFAGPAINRRLGERTMKTLVALVLAGIGSYYCVS